MRIREKILEELRAGVPFAEILQKHPGKSAIYWALTKVLAEKSAVLRKTN